MMLFHLIKKDVLIVKKYVLIMLAETVNLTVYCRKLVCSR